MSERVPKWPNTSTVTYKHRSLAVRCTTCDATAELASTALPASKAREVAEGRGWRISIERESSKRIGDLGKRLAALTGGQ